MLKEQDKSYLLKLARQSLDYFFENGEEYQIDETSLPNDLKIKAASIITLKSKGNIRGCIGTLNTNGYLSKDVVANTYSAAFSDPRFQPISETELEDVRIGISLISNSKRIQYDSIGELLSFLNTNKPGVIIKFGKKSATFMPEVWKQVQDPFIFMSELCKKADLGDDFWLYNKLEINGFKIEEFREG